jgi:predicted SprT family Zn-dependent metalloprotease
VDLRAALCLARDLLAEHGLHDWSATLDRAKTRAGACRFARRQISLSAPLTRLHSEAEVRDTILHEIAHALVGPRHGHDEVWRAAAVRIGCTGERCLHPDAPRVEGAWVGTCPVGHTRHRHRRPQRLQSCALCSRVFDVRHLLTWSHHGRAVRMSPEYDAQVAALRARAASVPDVLTGAATAQRTALSVVASGPFAPRLAAGSRARCLAPGKYYGVVGQVVKRGRTRYHLRIPSGVLTVPFALVEAA